MELRGSANGPFRAAFVAGPARMPVRGATGAFRAGGYALSSLSMSGKKGKKGGKKITPPAGAGPASSSSTPEAAAPSPAPAPASIPKVAMVDDDGKEDPEVLAKAIAILDAGREEIGDGVGIGPGKPVTFIGEDDGKEHTLGESERKGVSGDATVVKATSKTVTVRLSGKFWGSRQWAFDAVSSYLKERMPGIAVRIEEEEQLLDLYLKDAWYGALAWEQRLKGPQYVNDRGIQVAQPFYPDGKLKELLAEEGEGINVNALQLGIEEMMRDALEQSSGSFTDSTPVGNIEKALAGSQTAAFSETSEEADMEAMVNADDNIESVTKVSRASLDSPGPKSEVDKALQGNPMFQMMADILEDEPGAMEEIQEMLEKSKGNMFAIMANPKFQKLAQRMMENPELMQMMSDPNAVKDAMKSAEKLGITQSMGIKTPPGMSTDAAAKDLSSKTVEAMSTGLSGGGLGTEKPAWLMEVEEDVKEKVERAEIGRKKMEADIAEAREEMQELQAKDPKLSKESVDDEDEEGGTFDLMEIMQTVSEEEKEGTVTLSSRDSEGLSANQQEDLLYAVGGLFGVGAIIFFLGTQLGVVDVPFMQDIGVVSTPAARRGQAPADAPKDGAGKKEEVKPAAKKAPAPVEDDTPF